MYNYHLHGLEAQEVKQVGQTHCANTASSHGSALQLIANNKKKSMICISTYFPPLTIRSVFEASMQRYVPVDDTWKL